jgi:hypothetical protein
METGGGRVRRLSDNNFIFTVAIDVNAMSFGHNLVI